MVFSTDREATTKANSLKYFLICMCKTGNNVFAIYFGQNFEDFGEKNVRGIPIFFAGKNLSGEFQPHCTCDCHESELNNIPKFTKIRQNQPISGLPNLAFN